MLIVVGKSRRSSCRLAGKPPTALVVFVLLLRLFLKLEEEEKVAVVLVVEAEEKGPLPLSALNWWCREDEPEPEPFAPPVAGVPSAWPGPGLRGNR